ncbi:hypothetical protein ZWY2020_026932 [Hordeum vulgare]|nr:hypothetical protein ZWY2020_026932 [Hordeum vulgare]
MEFMTWSSDEALPVSAHGVGRHGVAAPVVGDEQCTVSYHTPAPITMKLLVDTRPPRPRVVFVEACKDAVDFLFSLLTLPAGTAVRLLGKESMAGSVGNLYSSVERLEGSYLCPGFGKDALLCPAVEASPLLRLPALPAPAPRTFFTCGTTNQFNYQGCRSACRTRRPALRERDSDPVPV